MKKNRFKKEYEGCFLRGGSYLSLNADYINTHYRLGSNPVFWNYWGFRCALHEDSPIAQRLVRIK